MENTKQQLEEVIKKNLPEKRELKECGKCNACEMMMSCEVLYADRQFNQALSQINTSLISDEVLKVVVETLRKTLNSINWVEEPKSAYGIMLNLIDILSHNNEKEIKKPAWEWFDDVQKKISEQPKLVIKRRGKKNKW